MKRWLSLSSRVRGQSSMRASVRNLVLPTFWSYLLATSARRKQIEADPNTVTGMDERTTIANRRKYRDQSGELASGITHRLPTVYRIFCRTAKCEPQTNARSNVPCTTPQPGPTGQWSENYSSRRKVASLASSPITIMFALPSFGMFRLA
jgi:hypothetical protein